MNTQTEQKSFMGHMFSMPHIFLPLFAAGLLLSVLAVLQHTEPVVRAGIIVVTVLFAFLWLLFFLGDKYIRYTLILPGLLIVLSVTSIPAVFLLYLSVHNVTLINFNSDWKFVGLTNYIHFFTKDNLFFPALIRTVEYMLIVLGLQLVIGMGLALLLQKEFRGRSFVSTVLVIPVMASPIVIAMLWKYMYSSYNGFINLVLKAFGLEPVPWLTNKALPFISAIPGFGEFAVKHLNANIGFLAAVIVNVWQWTPFIYLMLLAGLSALPREPYEAATVEGANRWQIFWKITFPLLMPVIKVVALIRLIDLMKVYDQIWALFGDSITMRTLNIHIFSVGLTNQDYSKGAALSVIVLGIVIAASLLFSYLSRWATITRRG